MYYNQSSAPLPLGQFLSEEAVVSKALSIPGHAHFLRSTSALECPWVGVDLPTFQDERVARGHVNRKFTRQEVLLKPRVAAFQRPLGNCHGMEPSAPHILSSDGFLDLAGAATH